MATPDGFLLCLFSNDKCIVIDDSAPKLQNVYKITDVWPNLATYKMGENLDAAYYCPEHSEIAFFKNDQCAIYRYSTNEWKQGKISDHFEVPPGKEHFLSNLTAASTGVNHEYYAFYSGKNVSGRSTTPLHGDAN